MHTVASGPVDEASLRYPLVEVGMDFGADARDVLQGRCPTYSVVGNIRSVVVVLVLYEVDTGFPPIPFVLCGEGTLFGVWWYGLDGIACV